MLEVYRDEKSRPPDLVLSVVPYRLETDLLVFIITAYDLGFHNRIG
jgi:hypothetical protein